MERMETAEADAQAVARARAGDPEAFQALVARHGRAVFRLAYRMTRNEHDAEDVVQETFLKAYRSLDRFEDRSQFGSWVYRIAANCALDLLRARGRRDARLAPVEDDALEPLAGMASPDPAPDRLVESQRVRRRVEVAMARMSDLERSAFTLRHFEGLSIEEIGSALGLDTSAAKQSVFRAVRKVREAFRSDPHLRAAR